MAKRTFDGVDVVVGSILGVIALAVIAVMGLITVPALLLDGYVLTKLWAWFVVREFPMAPHLGLGIAIGLTLLISFLTRDNRDLVTKEREGKEVAYPLLAAYSAPLVTLLIAYIVTLFI